MKITGKVEVHTVTDVVCDVCLCTTQIADGLEFATLQARWGYGTQHDGERYELHLCESCFFRTLGYMKDERRIQNLFSYDESACGNVSDEEFGLVARNDFFQDD